MSKKTVTAAAIREWAKDNMSNISDEGHLSLTGSNGVVRGRLHPKVIEAYERNNKGHKYSPDAVDQSTLIRQTIVTVSKSGRKVPRTVTMTPAEVRSLTGTEGKRGRIAAALKVQAAEAKVAAAAKA